jgi:hypothetical protein
MLVGDEMPDWTINRVGCRSEMQKNLASCKDTVDGVNSIVVNRNDSNRSRVKSSTCQLFGWQNFNVTNLSLQTSSYNFFQDFDHKREIGIGLIGTETIQVNIRLIQWRILM